MKKKKSPGTKLWILIGISIVILISLIVLSTVLNIGDRLSGIGVVNGIPVVEYVFYLFAFILFFLLILNPLRIIMFSKNYSIDTMLDNPDKYKRIRRTLAKNTIKNKLLKDHPEQIEKLKLALGTKDDNVLRDALNEVYNTVIKKEMNKIIVRNAKTMMVSTAVCQNGKLDMISVFVVNLKMIKELVIAAGFRPSFIKLGKISARILITALIAEGIEDKVNLAEILPDSFAKNLGKTPLLGTVVESVMQGALNALLCLRVGVITRKYLFTDANLKTKADIKLEAIKESALLLPSVVAEFTKSLGKAVVDKVKGVFDGVVNAAINIPRLITKPFMNNSNENNTQENIE